MQVEIAIDEADCIVFVVSGKDGLTHDDEYVARLLHRTKKPVILAVNKVDDFAQNDAIYEFYSLGLGDPLAVSGAHGIGIPISRAPPEMPLIHRSNGKARNML